MWNSLTSQDNNIIASNNQRLGKCGQKLSEVKTLLLQRCALRKFQMTGGQDYEW